VTDFIEIVEQALRELGRAEDFTVVRVSHDEHGWCAKLRDKNGWEAAVCVDRTDGQPTSAAVSLFKKRMRDLHLA
jgi:hypothetical protein